MKKFGEREDERELTVADLVFGQTVPKELRPTITKHFLSFQQPIVNIVDGEFEPTGMQSLRNGNAAWIQFDFSKSFEDDTEKFWMAHREFARLSKAQDGAIKLGKKDDGEQEVKFLRLDKFAFCISIGASLTKRGVEKVSRFEELLIRLDKALTHAINLEDLPVTTAINTKLQALAKELGTEVSFDGDMGDKIDLTLPEGAEDVDWNEREEVFKSAESDSAVLIINRYGQKQPQPFRPCSSKYHLMENIDAAVDVLRKFYGSIQNSIIAEQQSNNLRQLFKGFDVTKTDEVFTISYCDYSPKLNPSVIEPIFRGVIKACGKNLNIGFEVAGGNYNITCGYEDAVEFANMMAASQISILGRITEFEGVAQGLSQKGLPCNKSNRKDCVVIEPVLDEWTAKMVLEKYQSAIVEVLGLRTNAIPIKEGSITLSFAQATKLLANFDKFEAAMKGEIIANKAEIGWVAAQSAEHNLGLPQAQQAMWF